MMYMEPFFNSFKDLSEGSKNFIEVLEKLFQPKGLDLVLLEGHKRIIESYIAREDIDEAEKMLFLSSYKQKVKEYKNCAKAVKIATELIEENARPKEVEEDWFAFYFDKVKLISNEEVLGMWGRILAGEVNQPGTFSRALIHTLSVMSNSQANAFCSIAKFCMYEYKNGAIVHPLIFMSRDATAYENTYMNESKLLELQNLGLVQCDFKSEFVFLRKKTLRYGNHLIEVYGDPNNKDKIKAGNVRFTNDGLALFDIVSDAYKEYRHEILDFTITKFQKNNCIVYKDKKLMQ